MKGLFFVYALTYGGALVSLARPFVGLLIFTAWAILRPEALWSWAITGGNFSKIVGIAFLIGWALNGWGDWRFGQARAMFICIVGFWLVILAGVIVSVRTDVAWVRVENMTKTLLPFLVGLTLVNSIQQVKQLAWVIVLSQGYLAWQFNLMYWGGEFNSYEFEFGNLDNNGHSINMVACTGFAFFLAVGTNKWYLKVAAMTASLFMLHFVIFCLSRGGMLSLAMTGVLAFVLIRKSAKHYVGAVLIVLLAIRLAGPTVVERLESAFGDKLTKDVSAQSRLDYWQAAFKATLEHPVLGLGPDQWKIRCPEYGVAVGRAVHSTWLQVSVEHGIPGFLFLFLFYGLCVRRLWPLARGSVPLPDPDFEFLATMVVVSMVGFVLASQFVTMYGVDTPYCIALVGGGLLKVYSRMTAEAKETAEETETEEVEAEPEPE